MKPPMNKSKSQFIHTQKRAKERFGIRISLDEYNDIILAIKHKQAKCTSEFICNQSNRISLHRITYPNMFTFTVCYDNNRQTIVTIFECDPNIKYVSSMIDVFGNTSHVVDVIGVRSLWLNAEGDIINLQYENIVREDNIYHFVDIDKWYIFDGKVFTQIMK